MTDLKTLEIVDNPFKVLPDIWNNLEKLEKLNLSDNHLIKKIPPSLFTLAQKNFSEKYIKKGVLPEEAAVLGLLEILGGKVLEKCKDEAAMHEHLRILSKPDYGRVFPLHYYTLDEKGHVKGLYMNPTFDSEIFALYFIPDQISLLKHLEVLDLADNRLEIISEQISLLKHLEVLNLHRNRIEIIPDSLGELRSLKYLNLCYNSIEVFPESLCKVESLEEIYMWDNPPLDMPETIVNLKNLKDCYIAYDYNIHSETINDFLQPLQKSTYNKLYPCYEESEPEEEWERHRPWIRED